MQGRNTKIQKSLSISNKSSRPDKKPSPKIECISPLGTIQVKQKPKNKINHLSTMLNYSKNKSKGKVKSNINTMACRSRTKSKGLVRSNPSSFSKNNSKNINWHKNKKTESDNNLLAQYQKSVTKVFDVLDIFSRGTISEANISRWVPEAALYFLGSVFQKIRNQRVVMGLEEFLGECMKIYDKSADLDIKFFIENISKHENFNDEKISLEGEMKETLESHVEDRFSFPLEGDTSFRQMRNGLKTMPLQTVHSKEENRLKGVKFSDTKKTDKYMKPVEKIDKAKIAPLTNMNQFQNVAQANRRKITDIENLPLQINPPQNPTQNPKLPNCQSPFFQGSISNIIARTVSGQGKRRNDSENKMDRIDKLSMRLEDYIKENAMRIQRSKCCRGQL